MSRIAVIGLGNVLMGDDSFGPHVAKLLDAWYEWPDDVEVVEMGTQGVELTPFVHDHEAIVVVSSIHDGSAPGTLRTLSRAEVLDPALPARTPSLRNSPYEPQIRNHVHKLEFVGGAPRDVWVVGASPSSIELIGGLTPPVRAALPGAVDAVLAILRGLGAIPRAREPRPDVRPWWETAKPA
jgi:hydrogenase maturation protease